MSAYGPSALGQRKNDPHQRLESLERWSGRATLLIFLGILIEIALLFWFPHVWKERLGSVAADSLIAIGLIVEYFVIMRAIVAPPGLTPAQQGFWVDVFKKVFDSADWKKFMDDNVLLPDFRSGVEFRQFLSQYQKLHEDIAAKFKWVQ